MPDVRENGRRLAVYAGIMAVALVVIVASLVRAGGGAGADAQTAPTTVLPSAPAVAKPQSGQFDEAAFWQLTSQTRHEASNDTGEQSHLLEERLSKMPPRSIVAYDRLLKQLDRQLYTWDVWGAAYVIEDGCSSDCFRDFRRYLIFLGPDAVKKAMTNPDLLAPIVQDPEAGDWENADNVAGDAYSSRTGNDFPGDDEDLSGSPRGKPFDDNDIGALVRRYPRLAAKFR
jgi:hypothetical protein